MDFKEYLVSTGVSEEQAQQIVDGMPEKDFHIASEEHLDVRFEKMKNKAEQYEADLKTANDTLATLKDENKDVEQLQSKIAEYEKDIEELNATRLDERKNFILKEALAKSGAKDVDYMLYKLGDVEVDGDGNVVELDNKIKELQEAHTAMFEVTDESNQQATDAGGFRVMDNKLEDGGTTKSYSMSELAKLTTEEINQNWDAVSASLEKGED